MRNGTSEKPRPSSCTKGQVVERLRRGRCIMSFGADRAFVKRVEIALGWAILIGLTANLNSVPRLQHAGKPIAEPSQTVVLRQAMVVPRKDMQNMPANKRVAAWFAQFDQIRARAQMTPSEKLTAIKLWATSMVQPSNEDTKEGQQLLASLVQRYSRAIDEMNALPKISETKTLQTGYVQFFTQAHINFQQYIKAFKEKPAKDAIALMSVGRQQLAVIDTRNKNLDRRLRKQYQIAPVD
jgi:hypothetical protein